MSKLANCRHCGRIAWTKAKLLCHHCYRDPKINASHPTRITHQDLHGNRKRPLDPLGPTTARPGTREKILVMADRATRGVQLFHPGDAAGLD